jgi:3-oxoacyl-[acyl-carrier protein] reductase
MTYNAMKAAEISLAKSLALELASSNIRVNSVSPGSILFEGGSWWKRQQADPRASPSSSNASCPSAASAAPRKSRTSVAFLASPRASWISGTSVVVDAVRAARSENRPRGP